MQTLNIELLKDEFDFSSSKDFTLFLDGFITQSEGKVRLNTNGCNLNDPGEFEQFKSMVFQTLQNGAEKVIISRKQTEKTIDLNLLIIKMKKIKPFKIRLIGTLDLDLTKRGINQGEEFEIESFNEKTGACYIKDHRVGHAYPFVVYPVNYAIVVKARKSYLSEEERVLKEDIDSLKTQLEEVQDKIEKTCAKCDSYKHDQLCKKRTGLRKDFISLNKELKPVKRKKPKIR